MRLSVIQRDVLPAALGVCCIAFGCGLARRTAIDDHGVPQVTARAPGERAGLGDLSGTGVLQATRTAGRTAPDAAVVVSELVASLDTNSLNVRHIDQRVLGRSDFREVDSAVGEVFAGDDPF